MKLIVNLRSYWTGIVRREASVVEQVILLQTYSLLIFLPCIPYAKLLPLVSMVFLAITVDIDDRHILCSACSM
jgi:hypothetical protein